MWLYYCDGMNGGGGRGIIIPLIACPFLAPAAPATAVSPIAIPLVFFPPLVNFKYKSTSSARTIINAANVAPTIIATGFLFLLPGRASRPASLTTPAVAVAVAILVVVVLTVTISVAMFVDILVIVVTYVAGAVMLIAEVIVTSGPHTVVVTVTVLGCCGAWRRILGAVVCFGLMVFEVVDVKVEIWVVVDLVVEVISLMTMVVDIPGSMVRVVKTVNV